MKKFYVTFAILGIFVSTIHSQSKPSLSSSAVLIQIKASNAALIERQAVTIQLLKAMEAQAQQLRIVSKRG